MKKETIHERVFKVAHWIFREMSGELTPEEQRRLEAWCEIREENRRLYSRFRNRKDVARKVREMEEIDVVRPLEEMHLRIGMAERRRRKRWMRWGMSAALVALSVGAGLWLTVSETETPIIMAQQTIEAGSAKAILRLSDGRIVDLDTLTQAFMQGTVGVEKTEGRKLSYQAHNAEQKKNRAPIFNEIEVPCGGEYDLVLADGSTVWLNAGSKLRFPVEFTGEERKVYLEGEAYFAVEKQGGMPFRVEVKGQIVEVLGTEFNISGYADEGRVYTTLVTGRVKVETEKGEMALAPGEQCVTDCVSGQMEKQEVDVEKIISWKKGMFILEEQTLEQIMNRFMRWYNVSVVYQNESLKGIVFKGIVPRYTDLQKILEVLQKTNEVKFNVQDRTVIVYK